MRVLLIGIDGCTFDILMPWIKENKLPNIAKIMKSSAYGNLRSTIPPQSPPAWTSAVTGKNPGKHGIFSFYTIRDHKKEGVINSRLRGCKAIWNILSENSKKVGIINVMNTYPPEKVNGFIISGMLTPSFHSNFTYPIDLKEEISKIIPKYKIGIEWLNVAKENLAAFINNIRESTEQQAKVTQYLMKSKDCDFFMVVFQGSDWIQHFFWKFFDPKHPMHKEVASEKIRNAILNFYQNFDIIFGKIIDNLGANDYLIVMSDHGFGPKYKAVYLNNFLCDIGLIRFRTGALPNIRSFLAKIGIAYEEIVNLLHKFGVLQFAEHISESAIQRIKQLMPSKYGTLFDVDWLRSKAYLVSPIEQGIRINLKGTEPEGVVRSEKEYESVRNYIIRRLHKLKDPETGEKVIEQIYRREEIYSGEYVVNAPDLLINLRPIYLLQEGFGEKVITKLKESAKVSVRSADHNMNGIFIIKGPNIKSGVVIKNAEIIDIVPTILHIFGIPIPADIDGKVIEEIASMQINF